MGGKLFLLLLELQYLAFTTPRPVSNHESLIEFDTTGVLSPKQRPDLAKSQSSTELPLQDIPEQLNRPVIIRVDYSNTHDYADDDTQSSWLKTITGQQYLSTPFLHYQQVGADGEQTSNAKCLLKTTALYELLMEPYLASAIVYRAVTVLIFSTALMVSVVAMLWSSISPRNTTIALEDLMVEEKPHRPVDSQ